MAGALQISWAIKFIVGQRHPAIVAAFVLVPYGLIYFGITSLFKLPEANTVTGRFTRILKRLRR